MAKTHRDLVSQAGGAGRSPHRGHRISWGKITSSNRIAALLTQTLLVLLEVLQATLDIFLANVYGSSLYGSFTVSEVVFPLSF